MKKTILLIILAMILVCGLALPAAAADLPLVYDEADKLTASEEAALLSQLESISQAQGMDVVVAVVDSIGDLTPMEYADDFFDYNGYGQGANRDGLVLLISMEESDWWISTRGYAITAFTDAGIEYIGEQVIPYLSDGNFAAAFDEFATQCEAFIIQAKTGDPYDVDNLPKEPFDPLWTLIIAVVAGFVVAKIYTWSLKRQLISVRNQSAAGSYVKPGSLNINVRNDIYLYRNLTKTVRETSSGGSSTHRSSSGASHGGGGGKF